MQDIYLTWPNKPTINYLGPFLQMFLRIPNVFTDRILPVKNFVKINLLKIVIFNNLLICDNQSNRI